MDTQYIANNMFYFVEGALYEYHYTSKIDDYTMLLEYIGINSTGSSGFIHKNKPIFTVGTPGFSRIDYAPGVEFSYNSSEGKKGRTRLDLSLDRGDYQHYIKYLGFKETNPEYFL